MLGQCIYCAWPHHEFVFCVLGQGRLDGAVCEHTEEKKMAFLRRAHEMGVVNIEMECAAMAALCSKVRRRVGGREKGRERRREEGGGRGGSRKEEMGRRQEREGGRVEVVREEREGRRGGGIGGREGEGGGGGGGGVGEGKW